MIDTHAHLWMKHFKDDLNDVIQNAEREGITRIIDVGTDLATSKKAIQNAQTYESVYAAAGIHPHDASQASEQDFQELGSLMDQPKVVALGEIGLDYYYEHSPKDVQKQVFGKQLQLAQKKNIPVIIHVRQAMEDAWEVLREVGWPEAGGVFHCFGGTEDHVPRIIENGFHISFTGVITFRNFTGQNIVRAVPQDRLLLETDAPYMSPFPYRGERNEPARLSDIVTTLGAIYEMNARVLSDITTTNAKQLFRLEG